MAYFWPMPAAKGGLYWTGSGTCLTCGMKTGSGGERPGVPGNVSFQTKPQLAQLMLGRALVIGVPFGRIAREEEYGSNCNLWMWLER